MRHRKDKANTKAKIREKRDDRFLAKHQSAFNQKLQTNYIAGSIFSKLIIQFIKALTKWTTNKKVERTLQRPMILSDVRATYSEKAPVCADSLIEW